ncbi:MAG: efflux RND transporter permease subunit [Pseudomonadota bacterium]
MRTGFLAYFVRHRTAANLLLVLMVALGLVSITQIRAQFFPDVVVENVRVSVNWSGAAATDLDTGVVAVIEPAVLAVEGVDSTFSTSREGGASVRVDFEPGWDMARAQADIETAVGQILGNLPDGADDPTITRSAWRDRVTNVVISGPVAIQQLGRYADEFTARLFAEGVTRTSVNGISAQSITVTTDEGALVRYGITLQDVARVIAAEADASPSGDVSGGSARVRTGVEKRTVEEISTLVVLTQTDGTVLTVGDVAEIVQDEAASERAFFRNGQPALQIRVDRGAEGDAIGLQRAVEEVAESYGAELPEGVRIELTQTRSQIISDRLDLLLGNGIAGLVLVVSLLFLFLSARTAFWVAAGIPVAMIATFAMMFAFGITLNMISLFALIICLGIVVDDAIVVAEHADYRHRDLGEPPAEAATRAAERMSLPVLSATITTVLAFASLAVIGGRFGDLIRDIPLTVPVVLLASLIECFLILPAHMRHAFEAQAKSVRGSLLSLFLALSLIPILLGFAIIGLLGIRPTLSGPYWPIGEGWEVLPFLTFDFVFFGWGVWSALTIAIALGLLVAIRLSPRLRAGFAGAWFDRPSTAVNRHFDRFRQRIFRPAMVWVIRLRYPVMALAVVALAGAINLFQAEEVRWRFFNSPEQGSISGNIAMLPGTPREETQAMVFELARAAEAVGARYEAETGTNPIVFVMTQVGGTAGRGLSGEDAIEPDQLGAINIDLIDADLRSASSREISAEIEAEVVRPSNLEIFAFRGGRFGPGGDNLDVAFTGADTPILKAAAVDLIAQMEQFPEVTGLEDTLPYDKTELVLDLTPAGRALGFEIDQIASTLRDRFNGIEAARYPDGLRTATVTVRLDQDTLTADFLDRTQIRAPSGGFVFLSEIVSVTEQQGFASIRRDSGTRTVTVTGEISEDDPDRAAEITQILRDSILPEIAGRYGVTYLEGGQAEQEREFLTEALIGFGLAILGIYLTLAWIFSSWTRPMVVMAIIPFGLVGTIWGHYIWDVPMSIFTVVGLLGMTGIIINDSIVLITTIDEKAKTRALIPAVVSATTDRLRAVLLTTLTTVLGLAPLLYETSQQAQFLKPTVITLVYGLGFGMVLVLLIVPSIVVMQADVARWLRSFRIGFGAQVLPTRQQVVLWGVVLAQFGLILSTVGWVALTGAPLLPLPGEGIAPAFGAMVLGSVALSLIGAVLGFSSRPARKPDPA